MIPVVIVGLTAGISNDNYADEMVCLLRNYKTNYTDTNNTTNCTDTNCTTNYTDNNMLYYAFYAPIGRFVEMSC